MTMSSARSPGVPRSSRIITFRSSRANLTTIGSESGFTLNDSDWLKSMIASSAVTVLVLLPSCALQMMAAGLSLIRLPSYRTPSSSMIRSSFCEYIQNPRSVL